MAGVSLSGLSSGFDWQSLVNQLMTVEQAPITAIQKQQQTNSSQVSAFTSLATQITALQTAVSNLKDPDLFSGRIATSTTANSTWQATTTAGVPLGQHTIAVSQLATKGARLGASDITGGINDTSDVSGLSLATMRTGTAVTSGTFTINGAQVTVDTTQTLQQVFDAISTATTGAVTAAYDPATDKVTLTSSSPISLGAANDTSNFLKVMKLSNGGGVTATSTGNLGAASLYTPINSSGLRTAPTATTGNFTINGVNVAFDASVDTLNDVIKRINAAGTGATATYDTINDRLSLTNNNTGDLGLNVTDNSGGLLAALGLTTAATVVGGANAEYTIDGGQTLVSNSNTLDSTSHGIPGLSITVDSATTQTIGITADTAKMTTQINGFISAYNTLASYIDQATKITAANGTVTTSVLSSDREVDAWGSSLRSLAFNAIPGLSGSISKLNDLGIDFTGTTNQLQVTDTTKLSNALQNNPGDVEAFFTTASSGFAAQFTSLLTSMTTTDTGKQTSLTKANTDLDTQIATIQRRLDQQRTLLTNSFVAMEAAQSTIANESQQLAAAFGGTAAVSPTTGAKASTSNRSTSG